MSRAFFRGVVSGALVLGIALGPRAGLADVPSCPADTGDPAAAEEKARELFDLALQREASDPRSALEILSCVQRLADKPAVSLRVGIIAERIGNKKLALESFERYLALAGDAAPDRVEMKKHIEHLRAELKSTDNPRKPPPVGETEPDLTPPPTPEPAHDTGARSSLPGWLVIGAGGVLLAGGAFLLFDAKHKNDDVHAIDPGTVRWNSADAKDRIDSAKREQTFGYIALGVGAAAAAAGVWLVLDANRGVSASVSGAPGMARAAVRVSF